MAVVKPLREGRLSFASSRLAGWGPGENGAALDRPTLVLAGDRDPLMRVSAAHATARAVPGARLRVLPGVGHDLPDALAPRVAAEVAALARAAVTTG